MFPATARSIKSRRISTRSQMSSTLKHRQLGYLLVFLRRSLLSLPAANQSNLDELERRRRLEYLRTDAKIALARLLSSYSPSRQKRSSRSGSPGRVS